MTTGFVGRSVEEQPDIVENARAGIVHPERKLTVSPEFPGIVSTESIGDRTRRWDRCAEDDLIGDRFDAISVLDSVFDPPHTLDILDSYVDARRSFDPAPADGRPLLVGSDRIVREDRDPFFRMGH